MQEEAQQLVRMLMAEGVHKSVYLQKQQEPTISHMPVSLYPYQLSRETYEKLAKVHVILGNLLSKVAYDKQFVNEVFKKVSQSDDFLRRYLELYNKYIDQQQIGVTCLRSDYMGDEHPELVEFNLMSVGLNGISDRVQRIAEMFQRHRVKNKEEGATTVVYPKNNNQSVLVDCIEKAVGSKNDGIYLMLVHEKELKEFNYGDQNSFELECLKRGHKVKKASMRQMIESAQLRQNGDLYLRNQKIALVYFRTAYSPQHYVTEQHWALRQKIEKSTAVGFPTVSMQLINFKRMQAELSDINVLKRYLCEEEAQLIKSINGEIIHFENSPNVEEIISKVKKSDYVLKPNREGGGHNFFGSQVVEKLQLMKGNSSELEKYVLMNKIKSTSSPNIFVADHQTIPVESATCEFSTFGTFVYSKGQAIKNEFGGSLARLKFEKENQGGIAINKAAIAGVCLVEEEK